MRRISLALALIGAVAATGCSGGAKQSSTAGAKGVLGSTFTVQVTVTGAGSGTVTSVPAGINCSIAAGTVSGTCSANFAYNQAVTLSSVSTVGVFNGFYGACSGDTCALAGNSEKYVVAYFATSADKAAHPNWAAGSVHSAKYNAYVCGDLTWDCRACHGSSLQGQGLAPSCTACHPLEGSMPQVGHFDPAKAAWTDHGSGWDRACQRCHTDQGFRDFIGQLAAPGEATASDDHLGGSLVGTTYTAGMSTNPNKTNVGAAAPTASQYAYGPLKCVTCHNPVSDPISDTSTLAQVKFPSQKTVTTDKVTTLCAQCHQAREGTATIEARIAAKAPATADTMITGFGFANPHYLGAAATVFGGEAAGWVQYAGNSYTGQNTHGVSAGKCTACHDAHTGDVVGKVSVASCGRCHFTDAGLPVANFLELEESRQFGFEGDIDGDGNALESVKAEIDGLAAKLYAAIQAYATEVLAAPITYTDAYPYYMNAAGGSYTTFSARLQRAAVNYKWYKADPGAWAHNPRYAIEVIYDSIADLNVALAPLGKQVSNGKRAFNGHFGAAEDPSPYAAMIYHGGSNATTGEVLPTMGFTSAACYQCHGGKVGFATYLANAPAAMPAGMTTNDAAKVTAMQCATCHALAENLGSMKTIRSDVANVYFPPQKTASAPAAQKVVIVASSALPAGNAVCATCHSGRENGGSIDLAVTAGGKNASGTTVAPATDADFVLGFKNPHYLGAAGMMMGSTAGVMYQYSGKAYTTTPAFWSLTANGPHGSPHAAKCTGCHNPQGSRHTFEINLDTTVPNGTFYGAQNAKSCNQCHAGQYSLLPKITEYEEAAAELYAAIQAYASTNLAAIKASQVASKQRGMAASPPTATQADVDNSNAMTGICYTAANNPYFFVQTAGGCTSTSFAAFNPTLLKAAFNYQWTQKEPGAWAHNEFYVMQVIYDSIGDLGGTPAFTVTASSTDLTLNRP